MRKPTLLFLVLILALAPQAFAQRKNEFSVFLSDVTGWSAHANEKTNWYGGVGVAYNAFFTPRFSTQLSVAAEQRHTYSYVVDVGGFINIVAPRDVRTYPIDLVARYNWVNETRWKPYLGIGAHYVAAPKINLDPGFNYRNRFGPEVVGGVEFLVKPTFGITLDGRAITGKHETYDPVGKASLGVSWRF